MRQTILIVDDSPLVHQIYGSELEGAGYEVLHADDGVMAINAAFSKMPDLVLCDVHMPKVNGYQVCRLLKEHVATKDIPVIIITSKASYHGVVADPRGWSFQTGADGYIDKDDGGRLVELIKPYLEKNNEKAAKRPHLKPLTETEILVALSHLLDKQLYLDVTKLQDLNERKSAFVANVSHELKSPLTVIRGYAEIIADGLMGPVTEKQKKTLGTVKQTVDRLARMISDLLDLTQIEAGKMKLKIGQIDLSSLIKEVVSDYSEVISKKNISVKMELPATGLEIEGDKDRLTQVIINLLSNSIRYTPEHGSINVRLYNEVQSVKFVVDDNGPGIEKENLEKIFDMFVRIASDNREGTGLGLPIARDIVNLHGGRIWVKSEKGSGSRFIAVLPKKRGDLCLK